VSDVGVERLWRGCCEQQGVQRGTRTGGSGLAPDAAACAMPRCCCALVEGLPLGSGRGVAGDTRHG
jgi:hypothetical protein